MFPGYKISIEKPRLHHSRLGKVVGNLSNKYQSLFRHAKLMRSVLKHLGSLLDTALHCELNGKRTGWDK